MSKKAKLIINNQEFDFPLVLGSENEISIDVKQLRALTDGVTTIDPGFKNTASCESNRPYLPCTRTPIAPTARKMRSA